MNYSSLMESKRLTEFRRVKLPRNLSILGKIIGDLENRDDKCNHASLDTEPHIDTYLHSLRCVLLAAKDCYDISIYY